VRKGKVELMLQNNENYEKVFQDCERDIKAIETEKIKNEREIEERRQANIALDARKQDIIELRDVLRKVITPQTTEKENQSDDKSVEQTVSSESVFSVETPNGLIEIPQDSFKGFDNVKDATIHLLRIVKSPLKHPQIADALLKGGYETKSVVAFSENVRSTLRSASKSLRSEIIRKDTSWQLKEWFQ
jgi:hypothetical protein